MSKITVAVGSDHGGFEYKESIINHLKSKGFEVIDCGTHTKNSCDYPDIAKEVVSKILNKNADKGILICGTGIGMSISANKYRGIRAALCSDTFSAHACVEHNNANVLCLGQRVLGENLALEIVDVWLNSEFQGGRHQIRVDKIEARN